MTPPDRILFVSHLRRRARAVERELQAAIDEDRGGEGLSPANFRLLSSYRVPDWARGVRVERAGWLSWAVVATEEKGH